MNASTIITKKSDSAMNCSSFLAQYSNSTVAVTRTIAAFLSTGPHYASGRGELSHAS